MVEVTVKIRLGEGASLPKYQTVGSAGMDLCSTESVELAPMERKAVPTGVFIELPSGYEAQVRPRSGLALKFGVGMVNAPGTIDSDYRGEIKVILINWGQDVVRFEAGERVAQLVIAPYTRVCWEESSELSDTQRGVGGFGSTGLG